MRRDPGHASAAVRVALAHPPLALHVQASGNAVTENDNFSGDIVKVSFHQIDYDDIFKASDSGQNRKERVSIHKAGWHSRVDFHL